MNEIEIQINFQAKLKTFNRWIKKKRKINLPVYCNAIYEYNNNYYYYLTFVEVQNLGLVVEQLSNALTYPTRITSS